FDVKRCLIVAPLRVARDTWPSEIAKWGHLEGLTYEVATGDEKTRLRAVKNALRGNARIVIVNRENLPWLIAKTPWIYDMVVLDELSSFKSSKALRFKALRKIRPQV
ncbi:SNF2-related protein, partial [Aeromonas veronii]|uniref:SNF2-related protein n=1 Tax=Aeromonas veronii TaxID=654 RepID=UPI001E2AB9AD